MSKIDKEKLEKWEILKWFKNNDYIELQATRGTISRDSRKYKDYLKEYDRKLKRFKELNQAL